MDIKNSDLLMESKTLRESVIDRVEVLDKVKKLELLPDDVNLTVEMGASYYEVGIEAIKSLIKDNRKELEVDGLRTIKGEELKSLKDLSLIPKNTPHLITFPRRALLRIGMMLQGSVIAKEVRSMLLNKEEEVRTTTDYTSLSPQLQFMIQMEQRHNALETRLLNSENQNNELKQSVTHLSLVVDNEIFVNDHQKADIQNAVFSRVGKLTSMGYETHFQSLFRALKVHFNVPKYDKIKRVDFDRAIEFISGWFPKLKEGSN
ncbi:ORF6C domain-containing protein [Paenibacillus qinlingensis]|uniref:ORF6C domain-containing protein n=1 Tax=Paenibacillus qinlingensis TaxID=1837343 RepID=A0ABU1P7E0_9BACL|nr:ORF6C domain-containing protein [Paenibacillus qinlingensis]MDR6555494.1 hypothetical protein [Paenibacillus qinlingensis]